jgi:hypothetical protein
MSARRQVDLVLVGVLAALGGLGFVAAFRLDDLVRPVVVGAVAGVAVSLVATGLARRSASTTLAVAVPALALGALAGCGLSVGSLASALEDGPRTILTSAVPAAGRPELLLVPYAATGLAALLAADLAQRSRLAVAPALPPIVVFGLGLAFGGEGRLPPQWIPVAWVLAAAVLTGWRAGGSDVEADVPVVRGAHSRSRRRNPGTASLVAPGLPSWRAVAAVVLVAVPLAGCARWLGPRLPGADERDRFELRELVEQPARTQQLANPLIAVTAWQDGPDDSLFTAEVSGRIDRWRLAVLDTYDGIEWRSSAGFVAAGSELPGPPVDDDAGSSGGADEAGVVTHEVTETVEPTGLAGRWLPVVDRAVEVSAPETLFDRSGGVLLVDGTDLPDRYTVRSAAPEPDPDRLVGAAVADDEEARAALALPDGVPDDVRALADEIVRGTGSAYARAAAIERYLAASPSTAGPGYELATEELPSGHSIGHLRCFLFAAERCGRRGSAEQFVSAYALLARTAGLPTRVVVGFDAARSAGRSEVTAHDATAWAEVKLAGLGWVAFDPVPDPTVEITPPTTGVAGATTPPVPQPPTSVDTGADEGAAPEPEIPTSAAGGGGGGWPLIAGAGVAVGLLVLALPALWRGRRRQRRRHARTPGGRIAGAWATALDELAAAGATVTRAMAVTDVVRAGRARFGPGPATDALVPLGALVNRSHFAAATPDDAAATEAWSLTDRFRTARRKDRPLSRRLREYLILRSSA